MPRRLMPLLVLTVLLLAGARCVSDPADTIEPGDRVKVTVLGADELGGIFPVSPDGAISMQVGGDCKISGQTTDTASVQLKSALRKYVKDPQVRVELQKAAWVALISGRVKKPGGYSITSHTTLLELLTVAGGTDTNANLDAVNVVHSGTKTPELINLQSFVDGKQLTGNPTLANGDIVMVPEKVTTVGVVFVLGEVKQIGSFELRQGMKVHEAIAQAGGITELADPKGASVTSKDGAKKDFDLMKALAQDPAEDRTLSPGDTIYLRSSSGTFNIYGAVNRPGSYPIKQSIPLTDALAMAGGYTGLAQIQRTRILRTSDQKSIPIDLAAVERTKAENMAILPGDTIVVPQRGEKTSIWQVLSGLGSLGWLVLR